MRTFSRHQYSRYEFLTRLLLSGTGLAALAGCLGDPKPVRETPGDLGAPLGPDFVSQIHRPLQYHCGICHDHGVLDFTEDPARVRQTLLGLVDFDFPEKSYLLVMGADLEENHPGGDVLDPDSELYNHLLAWIAAGAPKSGRDSR